MIRVSISDNYFSADNQKKVRIEKNDKRFLEIDEQLTLKQRYLCITKFKN
jgi:hypothetical protein